MKGDDKICKAIVGDEDCLDKQADTWTEYSSSDVILFQTEQEQVELQPWSLVCETLLSRGVEPGTVFQLRQGEVGGVDRYVVFVS